MPFMKGMAPVRRTKAYLEAGRLILRPEISVMTINYNIDQQSSKGAYEFIFWNVPQLKFKNPDLQILKFKNMTPTPFIQFYYVGGQQSLVDIFDRSRKEIHDHIFRTFCLKDEVKEEKMDKKNMNPYNFGYHCGKWCICEIPGQVPCPGFVALPKKLRGKYKGMSEEEIAES